MAQVPRNEFPSVGMFTMDVATERGGEEERRCGRCETRSNKQSTVVSFIPLLIKKSGENRGLVPVILGPFQSTYIEEFSIHPMEYMSTSTYFKPLCTKERERRRRSITRREKETDRQEARKIRDPQDRILEQRIGWKGKTTQFQVRRPSKRITMCISNCPLQCNSLFKSS